ncbi:AzlC family ABC transporter permease [Alkaliphilus serpentinus]|uniref:AzlC family ABC transporter permease n=1 Tax=Alkaliphilus serpentinus TaxID=1482731 RepID=A0A833HLP5_9FIRM|nr:AzlC family ABC transporter permease [Alkaliphilus serpentinus]KAB3526331.1 AzlC family ABC transporter permease [Alkaliphilus serpentinus]
MMKNKSLHIEGFKASIPIVVGYLPIAMAFGMLSKTTGISLLDSLLLSIMVFAGASQFMALNLLALGVATGEIIVATLLMNMRHLLMSASIAARIKEEYNKYFPLVAFGITDETFSIAMTKKGYLRVAFLIPLELASYSSWVGGTLLGYLAGELLPELVQSSMGVALYAMFVAILIPEAKKKKSIAFLAISSGLLNSLIIYFKLLSPGWSLIFSIIIVAIAGVYIIKPEEVTDYE